MSNPNKPNYPLLCPQSPWNENHNLIWLGSTVALQRNIEKFNFPGKLVIDKRQQIISLLSQDLLNNPLLKKAKLIRAEDMPPIEKEFLLEHFLTSQSFHQTHIGEAFVLDETGEFLAVLNLSDHLMIEWIDIKEELETTWDRLVKLETHLAKSVNFAFSPQFGFLTSDATQCGTGLSVSIFLHLPTLIHSNRLEEIMKKNKDEGINLTGLQGDPNEVIGDILALHNNYTLGLTEENILSSLRTFATKLVAEEKSARSSLKQESESELASVKDKISRAYGTLMYSYQIEAIEALQALSLLKLGLDLNWIKGTQQSTLNKLLFSCRRAHLLCHYGQKIHQDELAHKRAEFIHEQIKEVALLF
jgi:protein arginine kinase